MTTAFTAALAFLKPEEGPYSDDPGDSGGPTNFGITLATLENWRGHTCTAADVQGLTWTEAQAIYGTNYWNPVQGDSLPPGVALSVFDMGVNAGVRTSSRVLQGVLGVPDDGYIGPQTLAALPKADGQKIAKALSSSAAKTMQAALGVVADGKVGPVTLAAVTKRPTPAVICALYDEQAAYYEGLNNPQFIRGWLNRAVARMQAALAG